jgi:sugar phosphate permease
MSAPIVTAVNNPARYARLRWSIFALLVTAYVLAFFHRIAPGVMTGELMQAFDTSAAALGSLSAMYFYVYAAMQLPSGVLADRLGARLTVGAGSLVAAAGSLLFGLAPDFALAAAGRLLTGLGVSVAFVGLLKSNTEWFPAARFAFISGLVMLIGNLGSLLAAGPLAALVSVVPWRHVFIGASAVSLGLGLLIFAFVRNRPRDAGLPPLHTHHAPGIDRQHWLRDLWAVLRNRDAWPGFWALFGVGGCFMAFAGLWGVPLLRDVFGLTRNEAALYTTAALAVGALGSFAAGWISDHLGLRKPVILVSLGVAVLGWLGLAALPWGPGGLGLLLYMMVGGGTAGIIVNYAAIKELVPPGVSGMAMALANTGVFAGAAFMQPAFGWAMDLTWDGGVVDGVRHYAWADYRNGLWLSFALALMGLVSALFIREPRRHETAIVDAMPD